MKLEIFGDLRAMISTRCEIHYPIFPCIPFFWELLKLAPNTPQEDSWAAFLYLLRVN